VRRLAPLLVAVALLGCGGAASAGAEVISLRVLFVGNSLTATNDLPAHVAWLAERTGRRLEYRTIAVGGFNLEDHWHLGQAREALATGRWDVVVMQQGPSALPESQADLRHWATTFADAARAAGTRPALLTVWPESYRQDAIVDVIASYRRAAQAAGADLLPAGAAWREAWRCNPRLPLYGADGFHPGAFGTYTAALVVYGRLFRAPLIGVPGLAPPGLRLRVARTVQASAAVALGRGVPRARRCGGR
jgi:hypothetical protein